METIVISRFKNKKDADSLASYTKKLRGKVKIMKLIDLDKDEDYFAKLIDEAIESEEVSMEDVYKELRK